MVSIVAEFFEAMDKAKTEEEVYNLFIEKFGEDSAKEAAEAIGLTVDQIFFWYARK